MTAPPENESALGLEVLRKVTWRIIPFIGLLFVINHIDRTNQLDEIRRRGWSLSDGESVEGVAAVAAPICHDAGIAAAVCISGPRKRIRATQDRLLDSIVEVANEIEKALQQQQGAHR